MSNIEKIKKMAKGIYDRPIQIGYEGKTTHQRKEGEEWTDARGRSWTIKDGKRKQITKNTTMKNISKFSLVVRNLFRQKHLVKNFYSKIFF